MVMKGELEKIHGCVGHRGGDGFRGLRGFLEISLEEEKLVQGRGRQEVGWWAWELSH